MLEQVVPSKCSRSETWIANVDAAGQISKISSSFSEDWIMDFGKHDSRVFSPRDHSHPAGLRCFRSVKTGTPVAFLSREETNVDVVADGQAGTSVIPNSVVETAVVGTAFYSHKCRMHPAVPWPQLNI